MVKRSSGNSSIEFVLALGLWSFAVGGFMGVAKAAIDCIRAERAARYGAMLLSTGRLDETAVRSELADLAALWPRADLNFELGRFLETPAARFYKLVKTTVSVRSGGIFPAVRRTVVVAQEEPA